MKPPTRSADAARGRRSLDAQVTDEITDRLVRRVRARDLSVADEQIRKLADYFRLLTVWNRKINLAGYDLDRPSDDAIDRLLIEPLMVAPFIQPTDQVMIDIGSGGGSPAFPIKIAASHVRLVLVEARTRKAAFLREVVRLLQLENVEVEAHRADNVVTRAELRNSADVITMRAVRADEEMWRTVERLLGPHGRVMWFTTSESVGIGLNGLRVTKTHPLNEDGSSVLATVQRSERI